MTGLPPLPPTRPRTSMRPRTRLVARIYVVGLAQIAVISLAFALLRSYVLDPPWKEHIQQRTRFLVETMAERRNDPVAFAAMARRLRDEMAGDLSLYSPDGTLLATSVTPPLPPLDAAGRARLERKGVFLLHGKPRRAAVALTEGGRMTAYGVFGETLPPVPTGHTLASIAIVVVCLAVGSLLFARALSRPLAQLARAARRFGDGELDARARVDRDDELGEVGRAFDEMAERMTRILRLQKEFLANVSHELRTPLSRIRVVVDTAAEGDMALAYQSLGEIAADLTELERLIDDVLTTARLDLASGRLGDQRLSSGLKLELVDAAAVAERAATRFRALFPARRLEVALEPNLPPIAADAAMLRRAVDNLLENACKYSDHDSVVRLEARATAAGVRVAVIDHGIGIDEGDLDNVFMPFFRGDRSRTRATGGVGLGLAITRRIVEVHGGTISVDSRVGQGTVVGFSIPAAPAA